MDSIGQREWFEMENMVVEEDQLLVMMESYVCLIEDLVVQKYNLYVGKELVELQLVWLFEGASSTVCGLS